MSALNEEPAGIVDELLAIECRVAFLNMACLALSEQREENRVFDNKAWEGLFYWTQDLEALIHELNTQIPKT